MSETLPLATAKARLSELIERVAGQHDRVTITRNGHPAAVLVSPDDLEELEETLAVMSDPELLESVRQGDRELARGEGIPFEQVIDDDAREVRIVAVGHRADVYRPR